MELYSRGKSEFCPTVILVTLARSELYFVVLAILGLVAKYRSGRAKPVRQFLNELLLIEPGTLFEYYFLNIVEFFRYDTTG